MKLGVTACTGEEKSGDGDERRKELHFGWPGKAELTVLACGMPMGELKEKEKEEEMVDCRPAGSAGSDRLNTQRSEGALAAPRRRTCR